MPLRPQAVRLALIVCLPALGFSLPAAAQDAKVLVSAAAAVELAADANDHSAFVYVDHDVTPDHDTVSLLVETPQGSLKRLLEVHGRPATPAQRADDDAKIHAFLADPAAQAKARKDAAHDDDQAAEMLRLLPKAFLWTTVGETGGLATLAFRPDPAFQAQSLEARVLAGMAGEVIVDRAQHRIYAIRGRLVSDIKFGFGVLGRLKAGGSFQVERREIAPLHWQMTESHVHIEGHALFFKTIGDQEDETHSDFKPSPAQTLEQAWQYLQANSR